MKKGFTLIELLSVIVILSVIAIIAVPIVSGIIETTKKSALKESANALVEEAGYYYMQYGVEDNVRFDIDNNEINKIDGNTLLFKGNVKEATVIINTKGEVALCINDGKYSVYKNYRDNKLIEIDNKNCNIPTGQTVVFLENESTIKEYTNEELTTLITSLEQRISQLENANDGNPAGTVISYMGNNVPTGYLSCDGTVYKISDYQALANQIKNEFGSYNYFGGDGETTFAVPDLRGEFLRGTGTNSNSTSTNTYSVGASVGTHQEATRDFYKAGIYKENAGYFNIYIDSTLNSTGLKAMDKTYIPTTMGAYQFKSDITFTSTTNMTYYSYSSRPTNTSVLYCIKY